LSCFCDWNWKVAERFGIVMPAYNAEQYIEEAIGSVQRQTVADWELVVVDDGSTDRTREIAARMAAADSRIRLIEQRNAGPSKARDRGFAALRTHAAYVAFLDADDVWESDALETLYAALDRKPNIGAGHGVARYIDEHGELVRMGEAESYTRNRRAVVGDRVVEWPLGSPTTFAVLVLGNCIWTSGQVLLRRHAFAASGGYTPGIVPGLRYAEDWDLWIRLASRTDLEFVDRPVVRYRQHDDAASHDLRALFRGLNRLGGAISKYEGFTDDQRRLARSARGLSLAMGKEYWWRAARESLARRDGVATVRHMRHAVLSSLRVWLWKDPN
jgi:glycosyltransferase involved in cell wall biosynthesis